MARRQWSLWQRLVASLWLVALSLLAPPALAQGIESVLRPGEVIRGHAKWEDDCAQCHVKFDRAAQDRLCMDCHKDVGQDVRGRAGYHGRIKPPQACRACHTDHKGRDARIVQLDKRSFDHALTDYVLRGKHQKTDCDKCHVAGKRWREAAVECNACHRKDDVHKGALGAKCADCHTENDWKEARFDHDKTRFALTGKHVDTKCADCHKDTRYKETPRTCVGCHKKDDDTAKGHRGQFGERCDSCHGTKAWKPSTFNHDTETKYALRGKHRTIKCADCHTGPLYKDKLPSDCHSCHKKDDKHKEALGRDCGACHVERNWKETGRFDHDRSSFPLLGKHKTTECKDCHKSSNYKDAPSDCYSCHKKDDKHQATLGTKFKLRNAHAARTVQCKDCHADLRHYRDTPTACVACHKKADKHEGQLGDKCEQCHGDRDWKTTQFDHRLSRFALLGRHQTVKCQDCHATPRYKDAPRDCYSCHKKDDKHKLAYGTACESCHNARSWALWTYDHARQARYPLDGAHAKAACSACHSKPAPAGRKIAEVGNTCVSCHRRDDVHDGAFGANCEQCHYTDRWKRVRSRLGADAGPANPFDSPAWQLGSASRLATLWQAGARP